MRAILALCATAFLLSACLDATIYAEAERRDAYLADVDRNPPAFREMCAREAGLVASGPVPAGGVFLPPPAQSLASAVPWLLAGASFVDVHEARVPPYEVDQRAPYTRFERPDFDAREFGVTSHIYRVRMLRRPDARCAPYDAWQARVRSYFEAYPTNPSYQMFVADPRLADVCFALEGLTPAQIPQLDERGQPHGQGEAFGGARARYARIIPTHEERDISDKLIAAFWIDRLADLTTGAEVARASRITLETREEFLTSSGGPQRGVVGACDGEAEGRPISLSDGLTFSR